MSEPLCQICGLPATKIFTYSGRVTFVWGECGNGHLVYGEMPLDQSPEMRQTRIGKATPPDVLAQRHF
jgi:hypothetical protein